MMMITPLLSARRRYLGGRGRRRRKWREVEEREDRQELRRQARTLSQVQLSQGCRMGGTGEDMDGVVGRQSAEEAKGARDQSYPLTTGMEGATERRSKL